MARGFDFRNKTNATAPDSLPKAIRMEFKLQATRETAEFPKARRNSNAHPKRRRFLKLRCELGNALTRKRKFRSYANPATDFVRLSPIFALKTRNGSHRLRQIKFGEGDRMSGRKDASVIEMRPDAVWQEMSSDKDAALVDVRTRPEWAFVGIPDLSALGRKAILAEWQKYPTMEFNDEFAENLDFALAGSNPSSVYFICRSGQRSRAAALHYREVSEARGRAVRCVNVSEGFEGVLDESGHRSRTDGWKRRGLPWRQS